MKTTLVAHLAVVGLLFGSAGAEVLAQDSHDSHDGTSAEAPRPRLKLPRARSAPRAPMAPAAPRFLAATNDTPKLGVMINISDDGLVVDEVMEDSLAESAGIQAGDMLLKMDGRSIDSVEDIREALSETRPGGTLGLTVVREGQGLVKLEASIPRPAPPVAPQAPGFGAPDGHAGAGAQQGGFLGVQLGEGDEGGVLVNGVVEQSAAWFAGLDEGDVLLKIGKTRVSSGQDVASAIASRAPGSFVKVTYKRDGEQETARVRLGSRAPTPGALGSFFTPNAPGAQGNLQFGVPGNAPKALPQMRVLDPHDGDWPFAVQGQSGGAQVFTFDSDSDGDGNFWVSDDEDGSGAHFFSFDDDDFGGLLQGHGNTFMLDLDDLEGLEDLHELHGLSALGDGTSLGITFEDGVLTIKSDGEVQVLDLHDLEGLEQLHEDGHEDGHGDGHGVHLNNLTVLPKTLLKQIHGADGDARIKVRVKRSGASANSQAQPQIRQLSFTPAAQVTTITTTTTEACTEVAEDCCIEVSDKDTECCAEAQETGDVN